MFWKEFKEFAVKGNAMDLAVGVIIGAAFGKIVSSVVNDLIMPVLGIIIGGLDFKNLKFVLVPAEGSKAEVAILYGNFIQSIIDFTIIAFCIFIIVKALNKFKKKEAVDAPPPPSAEEKLLTEIRDILSKSEKKE